ncbi:WD40-repeat-containing domain protein [Neohortaea acidophila]|uniref:WD40-repeat-containing domain protein n=1 Tax=Neohortaea acidophila TaxID=245834 RepID=A0A6A6PSL9_9PEZI|nr:WD40-repeat-containing domain protein [Neohortaea acidophila]KAF2482493.1 WD40-repeat-containing domain protein [Neohortaea acidophila]
MQNWSTSGTALASSPDGESRYHFRSFHSGHRAHSSHFQLRNLLAASNRSQVFYAAGSKVMATSLACPDVRTIAMDLSSTTLASAASMRVMCLSTPSETSSQSAYRSDKVLLAGGFSGEFALLDLTSQPHSLSSPTTGFVSHHPNGIVTHIDTYPERRSGLLRAAFSSNDHKLRLMDVKTTTFTHTFSYAHAVNCSAISPDGRLRLLVGDSNNAYITNAETGEITTQLEGHSGHGFAAAWSSSGTLVATGAQDEKVILWDARNWSRPLRTLDTLMSCARSLHFTDDDALVIAESEDVVSIYDARGSDDDARRQHLRFFGSIAGVCVLDGGREIAVANADRTVGGLLTFERRWESLRGENNHVRGWSRASRRHASLFCNDVML